MLEREDIISRLWQILASVDGVVRTARNPVNPPNESDLPCVNFFEMADQVVSKTQRGKKRWPAYMRELTVIIEAFELGTSEHAASGELSAFVVNVKKKLYEHGISLGMHGVEIEESEAGRFLRPPDLEKVAGVGIVLKIKYVEDVSKLFA